MGIAGERFAIELRWVREIFTLGHVTPIPSAPQVIAGATNFRGTIVPVLHGAALLGAVGRRLSAGKGPRAGDSVLLLEVDDLRAAIAVDRIDEVTTLEASGPDDGLLVDRAGRDVVLLDPPVLLGAARRAVDEVQIS
jgi:purine-binding chemotaxis protein CheW